MINHWDISMQSLSVKSDKVGCHTFIRKIISETRVNKFITWQCSDTFSQKIPKMEQKLKILNKFLDVRAKI